VTLQAVTFDFWDTLVAMDGESVTMRDRQIDGFADALLAHGHARERDILVEVFAENWTRFEAQWEANAGQYTPVDATDFIIERLGVPVTPALRADLIDAFRVVGERADLEPADGIDDCLETLHDTGVKLGIVCDVGLVPSPTLRGRLQGFGLLRWFDAWSFSDETGWFKPAAEAFRPVLERLSIDDPTTVAHVGDNPRTDVAGAQALGMITVRYNGLREASATEPVADHIVDDHRRIPAVLGVA
jgi:FMN phosphatase YigB (HAD superfamily)